MWFVKFLTKKIFDIKIIATVLPALNIDLIGQAAILGHFRKNAHKFLIRFYKMQAPNTRTWSLNLALVKFKWVGRQN